MSFGLARELMNKFPRRLRLFSRAALLALTLPAAFVSATAYAEPLRVVASFSILADMVRNVGGPHVNVASLVGPQMDAHGFEPGPGDVKTLSQAQVLVVNGLGFEAWLPGLQQASGFEGLTVVASTGSALIEAGKSPSNDANNGSDSEHEHHAHDDHEKDHSQGIKGHKEVALAHHDHSHHDKHDDHDTHSDHAGHDHGPVDPHAWQDLGNGIHYVQAIAAGLAQVDPLHANDYQQRAQNYIAQLRQLDTEIKARLAAVPLQNRKVISSHDAFAYFARSYGVQFIPVAGVSGRAEASARGVAELVKRVRSEKIAGIFVESGSSSRMVEQLARETGAKVGGQLYSDALAAPGNPADTYLGMMRWNAEQLLRIF